MSQLCAFILFLMETHNMSQSEVIQRIAYDGKDAYDMRMKLISPPFETYGG